MKTKIQSFLFSKTQAKNKLEYHMQIFLTHSIHFKTQISRSLKFCLYLKQLKDTMAGFILNTIFSRVLFFAWSFLKLFEAPGTFCISLPRDQKDSGSIPARATSDRKLLY